MQDTIFLFNYYDSYNEDGRLLSNHGKVEFLTTIRYIEKYLQKDMRLLEIGAGTGRYSHYFAQKGFEVDAVELVPKNIDIFKANTNESEKVRIFEGNATDLSILSDNSYDMTLMLGPMYHLMNTEDKEKALSEALRVTKRGGYLFVAYILADASILCHGFRDGNVYSLIESGMLDENTFRASSRPCDIFELHRKEDIEKLTEHLNANRIHFVATDLYTNHMRSAVDAMDNRTFEIYLKYHFSICERADMIGLTNHALDVLKKK